MDTVSRLADGPADRCPACRGQVLLERLDRDGDTPCPHCGRLLWFVRKRSKGAVLLTFLPGLQSGSEPMEQIRQVHEAVAGSSRVILNLSRMRLVSSLFLGMLVVLHRRIVARSGTMALCGLARDTLDAFRVTNLDKIFDIVADEPTALASLSSQGKRASSHPKRNL